MGMTSFNMLRDKYYSATRRSFYVLAMSAFYHCHMVNDEQVCGSNDEFLTVAQIYVSSS